MAPSCCCIFLNSTSDFQLIAGPHYAFLKARRARRCLESRHSGNYGLLSLKFGPVGLKLWPVAGQY